MWIPVSEPAMVTLLGYATGQRAPGKALLYDALPVAHHLNLAHGPAVSALRDCGARAVGTADNDTPAWGDGDGGEEAAAAYSSLHSWLFADPVLVRSYPADLADRLPIVDGDLAIVSPELDFYGVNYYNPTRLRAPSPGNPLPFQGRRAGRGQPDAGDGVGAFVVTVLVSGVADGYLACAVVVVAGALAFVVLTPDARLAVRPAFEWRGLWVSPWAALRSVALGGVGWAGRSRAGKGEREERAQGRGGGVGLGGSE